ncbi:MAG: hypothetical protein Q8M08_08350 [Bacteroidales bacterium]|nr:hypothetical protein [Bacteroidales bacterium]
MNTILMSILGIQFLSIPLSILVYIDPGTGSIILQALVATVVGIAIAVKLFWHRLLKFFGLRKGSPADPISNQDDLPKKS